MEADEPIVVEVETVEELQPPSVTRGQNLPLILAIVALLVWHGFQTLQLLRERSNLSLAKESQEAALQESQKVQSQFQTLVSKTAALANQGHAGARMVMEELQKRGIGIAPVAPVPETKSPEKPETKAAEKPETKAPGKPDIKSLK